MPLLHYAVCTDNSTLIIADLVTQGAKIHAVYKKRTALQELTMNFSTYLGRTREELIDVIKILIAAGANPNSMVNLPIAIDGEYLWPLIYHIVHMDIALDLKLQTFNLLRDSGANLNAVNNMVTPLLETLYRNSKNSRNSRDSSDSIITRVHLYMMKNRSFYIRNQDDKEAVFWLLNNGAKITKRMYSDRDGAFKDFPWDDPEYTKAEFFENYLQSLRRLPQRALASWR